MVSPGNLFMPIKMRGGFQRLGQLRTRVLLLVLLVLIPAFALVFRAHLEQQRSNKESVRARVVAAAKLAAATQEDYIRHTRQLLKTLANFSFLTFATNRMFCDVNFGNLRLLSPDYADFGLIEADGKLFSSAALTNANPALDTTSMFKNIAVKRSFAGGTLETDTVAGAPSFRFGFPITTNGEMKRILYASLHLSLLSKALAGIPLPQGSSLTTVDECGNILARSPEPEKWVGTNAGSAPFVQQMLKLKNAVFEAKGLDGIERLYAVSRLKELDSPALFVAVGTPTTISFAAAKEEWIRNIIIMICVATGLLAGAWLYSERLLLKPINAVISAAVRLAEGDLTARTGIAEGTSELHQLARNFDAMAESLARREIDLKRAHQEVSRMNADLERTVQERTAELENSNKELEAFTYSVSHDLRAPLRHMDGFAHLLLSEPSLQNDPRTQRYLSLITKSAQQMGALIDDLLAFSRTGRQAMSKQAIDSLALVQGVIDDAKADQNGRKIEWSLGPLQSVRGDRAMLRQAWFNLIANAVKYTRLKETAVVEVGSRAEGKEILFFVRDNGAGFDMRYADKLFGVFQRLHRENEFEGTGIGLANVRRIIHRHGGRTWAEGQVDKGATFFFTLPA
jgi:signal transduction histidine kinase